MTSRSPTTKRQSNAGSRLGGDGATAKKKTRKRKRRAKLPNHFRQKIYVQSLGLWPGGLTSDEITRQVYRQANKKIEDLMKHYKVPPHSPERLWLLSFYLARDMGLMDIALGPPPRGRGRPRKWKHTGNGDVASKRISERVDKRRSGKTSDVAILSKTAAATNLINKHPEYKNLTPKSLINRAGEAKNRKRLTPGVPLSAPLKQHWLAARRLLQSPPEK